MAAIEMNTVAIQKQQQRQQEEQKRTRKVHRLQKVGQRRRSIAVSTITRAASTFFLLLAVFAKSSTTRSSSSSCSIFVSSFVPTTTSYNNKKNSFFQKIPRQQQQRIFTAIVTPSSSIRNQTSTSIATASTTVTTGAAGAKGASANVRYPTVRGSEVDARKIIAVGAGRQHLEAVRIAHILFLSEGMAQDALLDLRAARISFHDLAQSISACVETRDKGGTVGWMSIHENDEETEGIENSNSNSNSHLDELFPKEARTLLVQITTKPGDIVMVQSSRGYHLVHILDVMANVRKMATFTRKRRPFNSFGNGINSNEKRLGILGGALQLDDNEATATEHLQLDDGLTYKMETMGCQMNIADSERMEGQLQNLGIRPITEDEETVQKKQPDVVILNTCSIRDHAEQKVYSYLGPHAKRKRDGDDVTIIVAGCVAQQTGQALLRRAPEVDLVMGPQYANRLGDLLEEVALGNQVVATEATHIMEDPTKPRRQSSVAAWVNVIYGCNERCTFCIVPTTRGVEQSRPLESIVKEVTDLVQSTTQGGGYKEVTLLGQNIDAYGRDMIPKRKFSDLIRIVGAIPGLERLRFVTSHPRYMSLGVVDAVAETPAACESFHIPFQSGSNRILSAMGRGHTREKYLHIVDRIRTRIPDASITADAIVGFPGETEEDFQETLKLMTEVVFDTVHTAAYSPRPNTPAAMWTDLQIDEDVKQERLQRINRLNLEHARQRRSRLMGQIVEVLVEERNVKQPTRVMGRTRQGYIVYCEGEIEELQGTLVNVLVDTCETYYLAGSRV